MSSFGGRSALVVDCVENCEMCCVSMTRSLDDDDDDVESIESLSLVDLPWPPAGEP